MNADWASARQQNVVLTKQKRSIQISSPQTGNSPMITTVESRLTTMTEIP